MAVYSERHPIPTASFHELNADGTLGAEDEMKREGKDGVVRMVHAGFYLDAYEAKSLRDWLAARIVELEKKEPASERTQSST